MATRLYLGAGTPTISPAVAAGWEASGLLVRYVGVASAALHNGDTNITTSGSGVANDDTASHQLIYGPLAAQRITGTLKGQVGGREASGLTDARAQLVARIIGADATTVRGTLYNFDTAALSSEFNISTSVLGNRQFPRGGAQAVTAVDVRGGDYLVVEFGFRNHGTNTGAARLRFGDATTTTDLPEDESTTFAVADNVYRGWIEFTHDFKLWIPQMSVVGMDTGMAVG